MGSSPTNGNSMECNVARSNINALLKGTIKGNNLRRTYYHIKSCEKCKEILLDEFSFYTTFNDLDTDLDFNYKTKLEEFLMKIENKILVNDSDKKLKYTVISLCICFVFAILVALALRMIDL